jgi:hypothetical protein
MFDSDVGLQLLLQFFERNTHVAELTRWITVALFANNSDVIDKWLEGRSNFQMDSELCRQLLDLATPAECIDVLFFLGQYIDEDEFKKYVDSVFDSSPTLDQSRDLVSATLMYNVRHHGRILIDIGVVNSLLQSPDVDHRITGLKAMLHSQMPLQERINQILIALSAKEPQERLGAMNRLLELFESYGSMNLHNKSELMSILENILQTDSDFDNRDTAKRVLELLQSFE